jgi:NAD(P)H dehydrogenase (quinone)
MVGSMHLCINKKIMDKILVTGATGILGNAVIEKLQTKLATNQIAIITRDESKRKVMESKGFTTFLGDYTDKQSLEKAMRTVDTVLLISAGDQGNRMQEHKNVIDAAANTGVQNIAYTSRALQSRQTLVNQLMEDHFETEDYLMQSGLNHTIFRNILYMDVIPLFVGQQVFETGILLPAGAGKVAFALRKEMGEAIGNVLLNEPCKNNTYTFTGNEAYSFYDIAQVLTKLTGKAVQYIPIAIEEYKSMMLDKGIPLPMVKKIIDFNSDIKNNQEAITTTDLERTLGRKPTSLQDGLKILFNL